MIRRLLAALAVAFVATVTLPTVAAADNCDIFINPQDCQNTGWTIGTIATVTGGVAVAAVALTAGQSPQTPTQPPVPPPPPPLDPPRPPRQRRDKDNDDDEIDGVTVRAVFDPPTVSVQQRAGESRAFAVRLEIHRDPGTQTVQEARHDPR